MAETAHTAQLKDGIRSVAARRFAEHGFNATGVREIAREAGVDPSLIIRHFGTKSGLFLDVIHLPESWRTALDGPLDELGERVARVIAARRDEELRSYAALVQASDRPEVAALLTSSLDELFVRPIVARLEPAPDAELRARLFVAQLQGLMDAIRVRRDPFVLGLPADRLARSYGRLLQHALTGALD